MTFGPKFTPKNRPIPEILLAVSLNYGNSIRQFRSSNVNILWCSSTGQCNICMFDIVTSNFAFSKWGTLKTLDKMEAIRMEWGYSANSMKQWKGIKHRYAREPTQIIGKVKPYTNGVERTVLYYSYLDLNKYFVAIAKSDDHPNKP